MSIFKDFMEVPRVQKALIAKAPGVIALATVKVPLVQSDQVLVRTAAVALNPSDHKLLDQSTTVGATCGCDFAGNIVAIGESVPKDKWHIGDKVFGVVFGSNPSAPGNGAFAQYLAASADLCISMPSGMDYTTAASMGMSTMTVGLVFRSLGLEPILNDDPIAQQGNKKQLVLVHGGATATGTIALQFLRLAGYTPITTCSPANFDLVYSRGAAMAFDYNDTNACVSAIHKYTQQQEQQHGFDGLRLVLDCIGSATTLTLCQRVVASTGGNAKYTALEAFPRNLTIRRRNILHDWVLGWTMFGEEVRLAGAYYRPPLPADKKFAGEWATLVADVLERGELEAHPIRVHQGGLAAVVPRLHQLRAGGVRGVKLVFPVGKQKA